MKDKTMKKSNKEMSFKEQLENYTPEQMEVVEATLAFADSLVMRYPIIDCDRYDTDMSYIASVKEEISGSPAVLSFVDGIEGGLMCNFEDYFDKLERFYPDLVKSSGVFDLSEAEHREKIRIKKPDDLDADVDAYISAIAF